LVDGTDRAVAAHVERHDHEREDHYVAQRQHRQNVRDLGLLLLFFVGLCAHSVGSLSIGMTVSRPRRSRKRGSVTVSTPPTRTARACATSTGMSRGIVRSNFPCGRSRQWKLAPAPTRGVRRSPEIASPRSRKATFSESGASPGTSATTPR